MHALLLKCQTGDICAIRGMSALSAGAEAGKEGCQAQADQAGGEGGHQGHQEEHQGVSRLGWAGRTATLCIPAKRQATKLLIILIITMPTCNPLHLYLLSPLPLQALHPCRRHLPHRCHHPAPRALRGQRHSLHLCAF